MLRVTQAARWIVVTAVTAPALLVTADAWAYCRATTCDPREEQCPVDRASGCLAVGVPFSWNKCPTNHAVSCVAPAQYLAWPASCVSFDVHELGTPQIPFAEVQSAVAEAFATWNGVTCSGRLPLSMVTRDFGPVACGSKVFNREPNVANANIITFVRPWTGQSGVLALTTLTYSTRNGAIYDADIEVNDEARLSAGVPVTTQAGDLQSVLTHEAGHFLGLSHTQPREHADAVMYEFYESGTDRFRVLANDDIEGVCAIYPPNRQASSSDCEPVHGWGSECSAEAATGGGCCAVAPGRAQPEAGWATIAFAVAGASLGVRRLRPLRRRRPLTLRRR